jgi:hypothetical protein
MDFTKYTAVKNNFVSSPNLCDLFKLLSIETWKRIEYAYLKRGIKVYETTLTQNILFTINVYNDQFNLNIDIYESLNENVSGNDIELIIRYPVSGIEFYSPIQAKKVYRDGMYQSMEHGNQINSLINYAKRKNAVPFYILYNYSSELGSVFSNIINPEEALGCTLIPASYLYNNYYNTRKIKKGKNRGNYAWEIPSFSDLNPTPAFSWYELVCHKKSYQLYNQFVNKGLIKGKLIEHSKDIIKSNDEIPNGFFALNTFEESSRWINIKNIYGEIYWNNDDNRESPESTSLIFSPKTRIVITNRNE